MQFTQEDEGVELVTPSAMTVHEEAKTPFWKTWGTLLPSAMYWYLSRIEWGHVVSKPGDNNDTITIWELTLDFMLTTRMEASR